jgi:cell division protein FtsZ
MRFNIEDSHDVQAKIKVIGIGGGGCNAVNRMVELNLSGIDFIAANTDMQALAVNHAPTLLQLGKNLTRGLGTGGVPNIGREAALEDEDSIRQFLEGADMVFITAGMGGGTGTGGAPIIAQIAQEMEALTIAIVTKPFKFEGKRRLENAEGGIRDLSEFVDTLITIPNQKLLTTVERGTSLKDSFKLADDVLCKAVQGISDLITVPGLINLDFADVRTIMAGMGKALMGTGIAEGPNRAEEAVRKAISSPLLDDMTIDGARGILVNITGGSDLSLIETTSAVDLIHDAADREANIIFGAVIDEDYINRIKVTVIATGFEGAKVRENSIATKWNEIKREARMMGTRDESAEVREEQQPFVVSAIGQPVEADEEQQVFAKAVGRDSGYSQAAQDLADEEDYHYQKEYQPSQPDPESISENSISDSVESTVEIPAVQANHLVELPIQPELDLPPPEKEEHVSQLPPYSRRNMASGTYARRSDLDIESIPVDTSNYHIPAFLRRKPD